MKSSKNLKTMCLQNVNVSCTGNEEINVLVWEWFKDMTARKLPVSGPLLQEKALLFAKDLAVEDFKASNGWLESFRKCDVGFATRCGESADVNGVLEDWKEKLPSLLEGYDPENIYNMDETGLFFRTTSDKTLFQRGEKCSGGKKAKVRLTVGLCASMTGEKEKPIILWKYAKPRCFRNIVIEQ